MKRYIHPLCLLFSAVVLLTACVDDDEPEITLYNDIAITSFNITSATVNKTTTAEDGTTSTSSYVDEMVRYCTFNIDHLNGEIYNTDPLPAGTDLTTLTCSYSTKNNGLVYIEDLTDGTWNPLYTGEQTNFGTQRNLHVVASDNSAERKYTVTVKVKDAQDTRFGWIRLADNSSLAELSGVKAVTAGGRLIVMGVKDGVTKTYTTADGSSWDEAAVLGAGAARNVAVVDDAVMVLDGGVVKRSDDGGQTFTDVAFTTEGFALEQLVGATVRHDKAELEAEGKEPKPAELYALTDNGRIAISTDGGRTWKEDAGVEDDARWLPAEDVAFCCPPFAYNAATDYAVIVGNRQRTFKNEAGEDVANDEAEAMVWRKIAEYAPGSKAGRWTHLNTDDASVYPLPRMESLTVAGYDGRLLAMGGKGIGGCTAEPYAKLYESRDGGITWKSSTIYNIPEGFDTTAASVTMTAGDDNRLWIVCGGTGQVWCGRMDVTE